MERTRNLGKFSRAIPMVLLLAAAAIRIAIAACDEPTLITKTLSDDAFYYFQIARNAASGNGMTFDGVEPANGFHPLWLILLVPVYLLFGDSLSGPLHAALVLEAVLDVGAGFFIYLLVRTLTQNQSAGVLGAGVYLLNPSVVFHSVNGLETGLNLFCFVLYFWFYLRMLDKDGFSTGNIVLLGFLSGILMLARSDNVIVIGTVYLHLLLFRKMFRKPGPLAASVCLSALVLAPWLVWNLVTFGTVAQSSGGAYSIVTRGNLRASGVTDFEILLTSLSNTVKLFVWTIPIDIFGWGKLLGILAGLAAGMMLVDESKTKRVWAAARLACVPLIAFTALALTHSLLRGTVKSWYFIPAAAVGAIFFGILCGPYEFSTLLSNGRARLVSGVLAAVILSGYALNGWTGWTRGMYPWQSEQLMAAKWLKEHVDDEVWVGSFNAGIIGYMSERKVVNLDGLVNNSVVPYLKERRLWDYILERDIEYLVDSDYSILKDYRDFYGAGWRANEHILRVATIDDPRVSWANANVGVYRVMP
ncbi:MAG: glycosyltransferase family 39 protein [Candidatus Hydrogenedentota bacterium]|nr:MAG: glycosyltransferase family 39 protein [Candidatus Hydrogenedentota bacterium]